MFKKVLAVALFALIGIMSIGAISNPVYYKSVVIGGGYADADGGGYIGDAGEAFFTGDWTLGGLITDDATITGGTIDGTTIGDTEEAPGSFTSLTINGAAETARSLIYSTASVPRWAFTVDTSAESGSDAGSEMVLVPFTDAGVYGSTVMKFYRASGGIIDISRPVEMNYALTVDGASVLTGAVSAPSASNAITIGSLCDMTEPPHIGLVTPNYGKFSTLTCTGVLTAQDTLAVTGASTFTGAIQALATGNAVCIGTDCIMSSPPPIGGVAPNSGKFTTVYATGTINAQHANNVIRIGTSSNMTTPPVIGGVTPNAGTFSTLATPSLDADGGTIDGTTIGGSVPGTGTFSALTSTTEIVQNSAAPGTYGGLLCKVAGNRRWGINRGLDAETGSDAGSPFQILAYTDAGAFIGAPISITRAAGGTIDLSRPVNADSMTLEAALPVSSGGTGVTTIDDLKTALGVTEVGTIASQDADSVNIDGGAIDGTTIGATSASTGAFTDLTVEDATGDFPSLEVSFSDPGVDSKTKIDPAYVTIFDSASDYWIAGRDCHDIGCTLTNDFGIKSSTFGWPSYIHCDLEDGSTEINRTLKIAGRSARTTITNITGDDTTPSVSASDLFRIPISWTAGHDITDLDGDIAGQQITIIGGDTDCIVKDNASLLLAGDWTAAPNDTLVLLSDGTYWYEISRSNN
jgi:hypothetical protein